MSEWCPNYGDYVILKNQPIIEKDVELQDFVVIGKNGTQKPQRKTRIGKNTRILTGAVIYNGCDIGRNVLVADGANIRENCVVGDYSVIGRHVCVEMNTRIGKHVLIETQAHITGNCVIEDYVFVGPHVTTGNDKKLMHSPNFRKNITKNPLKGPVIKKGARIGMDACILPGITIGEEAVIGAGAVVTKDVPPYTVAFKVPAEKIKQVPRDEWLTV